MTEIYEIGGFPISVAFQPGLVSIRCDTYLWQLADQRERSSFRALVRRIYESHQARYGQALAIPERSFRLEIYGHIYADYYLLRYERVFRRVLGSRLYARFLQSCEDIDCGDRQRDPNRWFWNLLSVVGWAAYPFFPRNISRKYPK